MKAVVIDDSPEIADVVALCFQLHWSGATIVSAKDGAKGLELIEAESPDVVILDIGLPDMDGFPLLKPPIKFRLRIFNTYFIHSPAPGMNSGLNQCLLIRDYPRYIPR